MNNTIYIFFKEDLLLGGTELLIERVSRVLKDNTTKIIIVSKSCVPEMMIRYDKQKICIRIVNNWNRKDIANILKEYCGFFIRSITFSIEDFCMVYSYKNSSVKTLLYTVYYNQLVIGGKTQNCIALKGVKRLTSNLLSDFFSFGNIVCMDEHTVENTYSYYGKLLQFPKNKIPFLRIPVDIVDVEKSRVEKKAILKTNNILTIARADFPWKGYILGLMDYVANNWREYNLTLRIVSYGDGMSEIESRYDSYDFDTKKRIVIQGKTDYDQLEELYDNTKLYIGQGTTVLDAAQRGILTIPVVPDTYVVMADDFFDDNPTRVTVPPQTENKFDGLMLRFYDLEPNDYIEKVLKGRDKVIENYGTKAICIRINQLFESIKDNSYTNKYVKFFNISKDIKHLLSYLSQT